MNRKDRRAAGKRGGGAGGTLTPPGSSGALGRNLFAAALTHFRAGRIDEAERACRDVLTFDRNHAHALHLLGLIAYQSGRHDTALELIGRAFALDRRNADCAFNMAQVLRAVASGASNAQIAADLYLSEATVKTYVSRLLTRLERRDRVQLAVLAYESGLVTPGGGPA